MVRLKADKTQRYGTSIGQRLKKAREDKNISLEEAHRQTKIYPKVIEALENDNLDGTLGATYAKAFLRNYAHYLELDVKKIVQEYSSKIAPPAQEKSALEPKLFLRKKPGGFKHVTIAVLAVVVWFFILGFATTKFIHSYRSFVGNKKISAAASGETAKITEKSQPLAKDIKSGFIPIPKHRTISLTISTDMDAWLKVTRDGKVAFHGILSKDSKETWQADKDIMLTELGRPGAMRLTVNGKDIDFSGRRIGRNIFITREGIDLEPARKN